MYSIYKIENTINGHMYIGQTKYPKHRFIKHKSDARRNALTYPLYRALNKYGFDKFSYIILISDLDKEYADWFEKMYIFTLTPIYNIKPGGAREIAQETKDKIRAALTGRKLSEEHKTKCVAKLVANNIARTGKPGKKHTEESKRKMSEAHKKTPRTPEWNANISKGKTGKKRPDMIGNYLGKRMVSTSISYN